MKFQKGDKIICINSDGYYHLNNSYYHLTKGKEYIIIGVHKYYFGYKYIIVDDFNINRSIDIKNFISSRLFKIQKIKDEISKR